MPSINNRTVFEIVRKVKIFLNLEMGITRGEVPASKRTQAPLQSNNQMRQRLKQAKEEIDFKDQTISKLRAQIATASQDYESYGIKPENVIWIMGTGRTGSTWLLSMMGPMKGYVPWPEPLVGQIIGTAYYVDHARHQEREGFIFGDPYKDVWLGSIRSLILSGATARLGNSKDAEHIIIKEPNGSLGAPLLMEAMKESRMIFLIRDPRDIVSSGLAGRSEGGWQRKLIKNTDLLSQSSDEIVTYLSANNAHRIDKTKQAYQSHKGRKTLVRYEDLRRDPLGTLKRIYSELELSVDEKHLMEIIEKRDWENIPEEDKGSTERLRKATPGGWRVDLTQTQAKIVEDKAAHILDEFYPGWRNDNI